MGRFGIVSSGLTLAARRIVVDSKGGGSSNANDGEQELEYSSEDDEDYREYSEDSSDGGEEDEEEEPPHPLGFPARGSCRYSVDLGRSGKEGGGTESSLEAYKRRMGYVYPFEVHESLMKSSYTPPKQQFPPISSYIDPKTASTQSLLQCARSLTHTEPDSTTSSIRENEIQEITDLFASSRMISATLTAEPTNNDDRALVAVAAPVVWHDPLQRLSADSLTEPYKAMQRDQRKVQAEVEYYRGHMEREHEDRRNALTKLLRRQEEAANLIQQEYARRDAEIQREAEEQERLEEERRKADAEQEEQDRLELQRQRQEESAIQQAIQQEIAESERAAKEVEAREREYVTRAQKLVAQLVQLRVSVEPFESSPTASVKKRRLQMKKLVGGKINTLTENSQKIKSVAVEVSRAIATAREEDEQVKQQLSAGAPGFSQEMSRGKRYLLDLLCSKVIVRIQAEGFNGHRGDGFPLANMLAIVSVDNKDLGPVLAAHIYAVCPTAIPSLPHPSQNESEDELMESLGMLKNEDGSFETFERFLQRTESIISLVADIMASNPPTHTLLGGHESAIKWLSRFLSLLPEAPESPLPLLTAPVLDAFLSGAGHMLANKHPEEFKTLLDTILNDVISRLDEGSVGAPSASRLKKTISGGFDGFKKTLPSKALPDLYYGASGTTGHGKTPFSPSIPAQTTTSNPFGGGSTGTSSTSNPFGGGSTAATSSAPNPFGGGTSSTTSSTPNPFGGGSTSATSPPTPFGGGSTEASANSNPFGGGSAVSSTTSFGVPTQPLFSTNSAGMDRSTFNIGMDTVGMDSGETVFSSNMSAAPHPTSFSQPSGFEFASQGPPPFSNPSTFTGIAAPSPSPFTQSSSSPFSLTPAPPPSPFGTSGTFGTSTAPSTAPLGVTQSSGFGFASQSPSPFSSSNPSPFTGTSTPFGQISAPTPFTQSGVSGASEGIGFSQSTSLSQSSPFGTTQSASPFGSGVGFDSQQSTGFGGGGQQSSGFGGQSTGFGGGGQQSSSFGGQSTGFGGVGQQPSGFGGQSTGFGGGGQQSTGFGGGGQQSTGFGGVGQQPSGFGGQSTGFGGGGQQSTGFGGGGQPSTGFGGGGQQSTGFGGGGQQPTGFGGGGQQQPTGFGGGGQQPTGFGGGGSSGREPCRFYARGRCTFGANCRYSHDLQQGNTSSFSNNSFGGPRR